ncbi:MAG: folate-binding protein [Solirubrobacterales bacterium]|nr:folate-binding protein [Solirubrobacterales bacterium]
MATVSIPPPEGPGPTSGPAPGLDAEYRQVREECAVYRPDHRAWITVTGADAAEYLQSQVTNEIESLTPGSGCYALLLNRKGHIQAEMRILRLADDEFLLETDEAQQPGLFGHLAMYRIGRKVEVAEVERAILTLLGPGTPEVAGLAPGSEHSFVSTVFAGADCLAVATRFGLDLLCDPADRDAVGEELERRRAVPVSETATEILRVEAGRPRFGRDISEASMPAEAGLVERAVNFEKGCYIGQEPVARLHYRGRPNRHLRGLRFEGPVDPGDLVLLEERELGTVGSAVISPALGRIGLAVLRREAEPGMKVTVVSDGIELEAEVVELPFRETGP